MCRYMFTVGLVLLLSACGLKPIVGTSEAVTRESEFAYILVGVDTTIEAGFEADWEIAWVRDAEDVTFIFPTDPTNVHDRLLASSVTPVAGDDFEGVTFFLRKVRPGDYRLLNLMHRIGPDRAYTRPKDKRIRFSVSKAEVSYIGTFTIDAHNSPCLLPTGYRVETDKARRYLKRFTAISVPVLDITVINPTEVGAAICEYQKYTVFF